MIRYTFSVDTSMLLSITPRQAAEEAMRNAEGKDNVRQVGQLYGEERDGIARFWCWMERWGATVPLTDAVIVEHLRLSVDERRSLLGPGRGWWVRWDVEPVRSIVLHLFEAYTDAPYAEEMAVWAWIPYARV